MGSPENLQIGQSTVITSASLDARGGIIIGDYCIINDDVQILTASHNFDSPNYETTYDSVKIGRYCWLATGASILPGNSIGDGAIVGAKAVVTHEVRAMEIVAGNPARVIGTRKCVHDNFPVESLVGADYSVYLWARNESRRARNP